MDASIVNTYKILAEESPLEMLIQHREHFEDLKNQTGYLFQPETECLKLINDKIEELESQEQE